MTAIIFNGKEFARKKEEELVRVIRGFRPTFAEATAGKDIGKTPKLVAVLVGDNPESELYLRLKEKAAKRLGIEYDFRQFSGEDPQEIMDFIKESNLDPSVNGILIELPLPEEFKVHPANDGTKFKVIDAVDPAKDIDCLTEENLKLLKEGKGRFIPPTVKAVGEILKEAERLLGESGKIGKIREREVVVVGSEGAVGKAILSYLKNLSDLSNLRGVDRETKDLVSVTKEADILISATGVGHLIKREMVKPGAIVIDVGIEKQKDGNLIGDVDFEEVKGIASFITPVPGGVGPVTIICLMENLVSNVYH